MVERLMAEARWEDAFEQADPGNGLAVVRHELDFGTLVTLDGTLPVARITLFGNPFRADGSTDTATMVTTRFVMRVADARAFAAQMIEATERKQR